MPRRIVAFDGEFDNDISCAECYNVGAKCRRGPFKRVRACARCVTLDRAESCTYPSREEDEPTYGTTQTGRAASTTDTVEKKRRKGDQRPDVPKCAKCRKDKQRCEFLKEYSPGDKCRRCTDNNFECSEPTVSTNTRGPAKHPWSKWEWSAERSCEFRTRKGPSGDLEYQYRIIDTPKVETDQSSSHSLVPSSTFIEGLHRLSSQPPDVLKQVENTFGIDRQDTLYSSLDQLQHQTPSPPPAVLDVHQSSPLIIRAEPVALKRKWQTSDEGLGKSTLSHMRHLLLPRNTYQFSPLQSEEYIRILCLLPGPADGALVCNLITFQLPSSRSRFGKTALSFPVVGYEALSYVWGLDAPSYPITILSPRGSSSREIANADKLYVRSNLFKALCHLRRPDMQVNLWVDALCINHDDLMEKNFQVPRIPEIFNHASNVCIWLGAPVKREDKHDAKETFQFMRDILDLTKLDRLLSVEHKGKWYATANIMRNQWFTRRWIIQEMAFARSATIHFGDEVMLWRDFADAVGLFGMKYHEIQQIFNEKRDRSANYETPPDLRLIGAKALVDLTHNLFRRSRYGEVVQRLLSLESLVSRLQAFECSDPRDTVYALLHLARDDINMAFGSGTKVMPKPPDDRIFPNYEKSLLDVFTDFIEYCVEKSHSLDITCRHWAPEPKTPTTFHPDKTQLSQLPSWIPSISGSAFGDAESALMGRANGDSFVGLLDRHSHPNYSATEDLVPHVTFGMLTSDPEPSGPLDTRISHRANSETSRVEAAPTNASYRRSDGTMSVKGMRLGIISQLSPRAIEGMIAAEALELGGFKDEDLSTGKVPDELWRTFVADRDPHGSSPPTWYRRACLECLSKVTQNGDLNTPALMENPGTPPTMRSFLKRVQSIVWNRKFLRSRGPPENPKSFFGLAPPTARVDDLVCILFGCSVPVVLRETTSADGSKNFQLIGEAYIHGIMDGEALPAEKPVYPYDSFETFVLV